MPYDTNIGPFLQNNTDFTILAIMPGRNSTPSHLPVVQFPALVSFIGWIVPYILPYFKIERLALSLDAQRNFQPIIASLASSSNTLTSLENWMACRAYHCLCCLLAEPHNA